MRAWVLPEQTGIEKIRLVEVADPRPGPDEVLLRVHYAGLNPADRYLAEKLYPARPKLPHILGRDAMGSVVELGEKVTGIQVGQTMAVLRGDVGGNRPGTFAELVAVPADNLVAIPDGWSETESAGATLVYLTSYQALTMWGPLPNPARVLITGASGGVGVSSVQLAAAMGHVVIGLSRSRVKADRLRQLGATFTVNPEDPGWQQRAREFLSPGRVDLAIDNIGGPLLPEVIELIGDNGRISLVGRLAGPVPSFNTATLFFRRLRMGGVAVGTYSNAEARAAWDEVVHLMGRRRPVVDSVFPFAELPQAFARLAEGPMGKVLIQVKE